MSWTIQSTSFRSELKVRIDDVREKSVLYITGHVLLMCLPFTVPMCSIYLQCRYSINRWFDILWHFQVSYSAFNLTNHASSAEHVFYVVKSLFTLTSFNVSTQIEFHRSFESQSDGKAK